MRKVIRDLILAFLAKQGANPIWNVLVKTKDGVSVNPITRLTDEALTAKTVDDVKKKVDAIFEIAERQPDAGDAEMIKQIVSGLREKFNEKFQFFQLLEKGQFKDALSQSIEKQAPSLLDAETRKPKLKIRTANGD